ncbi:dTTP/UTP pyrophosphatase [Labeo rohita]|uniref:dTTP/UTP pyrophosphatase n=1 Tax=Labeo rohita TaxID=84645 RepID=A0ABQ8MQ53_LABRO|nr:dTTP/UTP pyrophosphatase [Labeo rohita]
MAELPTICVSSNPSAMGDVTQNLPVQAQSATCGTTVASQTMVSFVAETSDRQSVAASPQKGPPLPAGGQHLAPGPSSSAALGLAIGINSPLEHCDPAVIHTISNARASSTRQIYASRWKLFSAWCEEHALNPATCDIPSVLRFLQRLLEEGKAAATLKVYVAAISAHHVPVEGSSLGSHKLVCSFLKGARRLKPVRNPHFPVWDLPTVLSFLCSSQFEPLQSNDIKWISLKTVFLLAVASAKRVGELHALSVSELCLRWLPDNSGVVLRPNPSFLPKVLLPQFINQNIELASFQTSSGSDSGTHLLCPVRALKCYVDTTAQFRRSDQLFVCYGGVKKGSPVSKQRLSNWIVETIILAYKAAGKPLPSGLTCHSTRAISSSWAVFRGVSLADICTAATWVSPCTFARFYKVNAAAHHAVCSAVLQEQP